ncbi:MAG TPA: hypothetical protein VJ571_09135 [Candidatus Nitrosotalea sp.]|nr:hypothetical protein [Candidatus Nitrosotalea sp.]
MLDELLRRSVLLVIPILSGILFASPLFLVAHAQETSPVQQVTQSGVTMQFSFSPSSPKINDYTTLMFSMINSTTGKQVQNYIGSITIGNVAGFTGGSGYYNFSKIAVTNGNFSVNYAFPNDGTFPVFFRADYPTSSYGSSGLITVGVFQVFVPAQAPPIDNTMIYVGIVVAAGAIGGTIIFMKRKKPSS